MSAVSLHGRLAAVADLRIPTASGDLPARHYTVTGAPAARFVWVHGGAFVLGDLDMAESDTTARRLADIGIEVLALDYRYANARTHILDLCDDVQAGWLYAVSALGNGSPWHLGGASAGGCLVAGVAKRLRDEGQAVPRTLTLLYPVLHAGLPDPTPELAARMEGVPPEWVYDNEAVRAFTSYAQGDAADTHPYAFPANGSLAGLPPVHLIVSELDLLRMSAELFAGQLTEDGVSFAYQVEPGAMHGHLERQVDDAGARSVRRIAGWLTSEAFWTA
ncbi:alpha/beta hydrolase fold domain-containing protein [Gulosibacter sp. ACHW.36C]|uniref:Alpha/beta hydrolase n=1 Tax=Gulosibacter sediminis TaxID=1729695 RepID=A0ABY4MYG5_9MICO|nr:alpha/beta hydrolase [Gulosibacter sediminis]UQN14243.1 alpha/beta hydrolase [Gulosibacter sediminis]